MQPVLHPPILPHWITFPSSSPRPLPRAQLLPLSPLSTSLLQHWDLCTKTTNVGWHALIHSNWEPQRLGKSQPISHTDNWCCSHPSVWGHFFLLSKVMANDWPREILYPTLWNFSRALGLTPSTVVLCSYSLSLCCIPGGCCFCKRCRVQLISQRCWFQQVFPPISCYRTES